MLRCIALLASLLAASPLIAEPHHVTGRKDGVSFDYTAYLMPNGDLILRGTYLNTREQFELIVSRRGQVDGTVGYSPVSFDVSRAERDHTVAKLRAGGTIEIAQRAPLR